MTKTIEIKLKKELIYESVKTDTYVTGKSEMNTDGSSNAKVFNEQAGDDEFHDRKLSRTLRGAIGTLETNMIDFVDSKEGTISDTISKEDGTIIITVVTSDRFNASLANTLAQLSQEFIINQMIALWWLAIKPELANQYKAWANESWLSVRRCLTKMAPAASTASYDEITGTVK